MFSTEAVNQFPYSNVWAVLFFLMVKPLSLKHHGVVRLTISQLFTLGLDSQFGTVQGVIQAAVDLKIFPDTVRKEFQTGEDSVQSNQSLTVSYLQVRYA